MVVEAIAFPQFKMKKLVALLFIISTISMAQDSVLSVLMNSTWSTTDGADTSLHQNISENVAVINFWASWCAPCVKEIPSLIELSEAKGIQVILINIDNDGGISSSQMQEKYPSRNTLWLLDTNETHRNNLGILSLPVSYIVKKDLSQLLTITGEQTWSAEFIQSKFRQ